MSRRPGITLLALFVILSFGGILCAQAQAASAAACCKSSCPRSQHRDPAKCCNLSLTQSTVEVASANHGAADPMQMTALNSTPPYLATIELAAVTFKEIHPPPGRSPSPVHLCSLQI